MISLTQSNGDTLDLDGTTVLRIRKTVAHWDNDLGNTLVNAARPLFVMEEASAVSVLVKAELPGLDSLTQPGGSPVWFNPAKSSGPIPVASPGKDGINSALDIGGKRQYVRETSEEVRAKIEAGGGEVQPLPGEAFWNQAIEAVKDFFDGVEDWDPNRGVETPEEPAGS